MRVKMRWMGLVVLLSLAQIAFAADVSGAWKGSFEFNGNNMPLTITLKSAGDAVTGTVEGLPTTPAEIHDGKVNGEAVSFWLNTDYQGQTYKLVYSGKIEGSEIKFSFGTEDGSWGATMTAKKEAAPDISGAWSGTFDLNGTDTPMTINLKSMGAVVTGTVVGVGKNPIEIHEGKIEGDAISFWINAEYQGNTYAVIYKGKISAGQIDFSLSTVDETWSSRITVKKA